jgi:cytochrome P450
MGVRVSSPVDDKRAGDIAGAVETFNIFQPQVEPHALFSELRESCPVGLSNEVGGFALVTRSEDIYAVLKDPATFSNAYDWPPGHETLGPRIPVNYDPPIHTGYRQVFAPWFSPTVVESIEDATRQKALELLGPIAAKEECDFVAEFCQRFPSLVFLPFLGLDADELDDLLSLHHDIFILLHSGPSGDGGSERTVRSAEEKLRVKVNVLLDKRLVMPEPPDDIFTRLLNSRLPDGRALTREEMLSSISLLFGAGLGTVKFTLSMAMWFLGTHPDYRDQLVEDPELIPGAVEEFLRYFATVVDIRRATRDVDLHDTTLKRGTILLCPLASAGRDPDAHENPDLIDFRRTPNRHYGFGAGPHRCLGSHLARMELRVALEEIHRIMPDYSVDPSTPPRWTWGLLFGMESLPLTVGRTSVASPAR